MSNEEAKKRIEALKEQEGIEFIDYRFTSPLGRLHSVTMPIEAMDDELCDAGKAFDGSSIPGLCSIDQSDMMLEPDFTTLQLDAFAAHPTASVLCNLSDPVLGQNYPRCPRGVAQRAEAYLRSTGIADSCSIGPELEFHVLDHVAYQVDMQKTGFSLDSEEGQWNSGAEGQHVGNRGHRPGLKGGYLALSPADDLHDLRSSISKALMAIGQTVEVHHHEVGMGQCEIGVKYGTLVHKADEVQAMKHVIRNQVHGFGKTATFMPKPVVGDNGNGMHCHISLRKGDKNLFSGDQYSGLSQQALYFIGGILQHAPALNAILNPTTNSYKRLVPGFEAPVNLAYSFCNRSGAIRIPFVTSPEARRIEVRFPDPSANPYLGFAALLMAGLDGIEQQIDPGEPMDKNLYDLPMQESRDLPQVSRSLEAAIEALRADHQFLLVGDVFSNDLLNSYIALKQQEIERLNSTTHPVEFDMYYGC